MAPPIQFQELRVSDHLSLLRWKRQLRAILLTQDAWKVINGDLVEPTHPDQNDKSHRKDLDRWKRLNNIALGWMLLTLEDYSRQSIERYSDPLEAMRTLFKKFTPPFMTFDEFTGKESPTLSSDVAVAPGVLVDRTNGATSPSNGQKREPRIEIHRAGSQNANIPLPNIAGVIEAPRSPRSPSRVQRQEVRNDETRLTPRGIQNLVRRRELLTTTTDDSTGSASTTRRNRLMNRITGSKPTSPNPESDRASLTLNQGDIARPITSRDENDPIEAIENPVPMRSSAFTDSNIVVPERNVSLALSDHGRDGTRRRQRKGMRGAKSYGVLREEEKYMMSGALQD